MSRLAALLTALTTLAAVTATAVSGEVATHVAAACHAHKGLPDRSCTPGVRDHHVMQKNIQKTICKSGYSGSVRPPSSYTTKLKKKQMAE